MMRSRVGQRCQERRTTAIVSLHLSKKIVVGVGHRMWKLERYGLPICTYCVHSLIKPSLIASAQPQAVRQGLSHHTHTHHHCHGAPAVAVAFARISPWESGGLAEEESDIRRCKTVAQILKRLKSPDIAFLSCFGIRILR